MKELKTGLKKKSYKPSRSLCYPASRVHSHYWSLVTFWSHQTVEAEVSFQGRANSGFITINVNVAGVLLIMSVQGNWGETIKWGPPRLGAWGWRYNHQLPPCLPGPQDTVINITLNTTCFKKEAFCQLTFTISSYGVIKVQLPRSSLLPHLPAPHDQVG